MVEYDNGIVDDIFNVLLEKSEIDNEDLIRIFEQHNSYINVGIEDDEIRKRVEKNIFQVVKAVNYTYEVSKISFGNKKYRKTIKQCLSNWRRFHK